MSKKLVVLLTTLAAGWLWASEPATSSTSTSATASTLGKRPVSESAAEAISTSEKRARSLPHPASVQACFAPRDKILDEIAPLLNNAKNQILIAMYTFTSQSIINKLIELKSKVDIQIIFDQNTLEREKNLVDDLLYENILPIVYPRRQSTMHNKFMVIDDTWVVTGSANFTTAAFGNSSSYSNYENIVIINSNEIAQEYHEEFNRIKDKTLHLYLNIIASSNPLSIEPWLKELAKKLYQENNQFKQIIYEHWDRFNQHEKNRLQQFFRWRVQPWQRC